MGRPAGVGGGARLVARPELALRPRRRESRARGGPRPGKHRRRWAYPLGIHCETDEDPNIHIDKEVTNESGFVWDAYIVTLDTAGGATFVSGSASSDTFGVESMDDTAIVFGSPGVVGIGETVTVIFDINIPSGGSFDFTLTQAPLPEPTAMLLLAGGGVLGLLRRSRR